MYTEPRDMRVIAMTLKAAGMHCNCDLNNWQPERSTGHSWVCRIHNAAVEMKQHPRSQVAPPLDA